MSEEVSSDERPAEGDDEATEAIPEGFVEQVAAHDEELAEVAARAVERTEGLERRLEETREHADELMSRLKRSRADFENYKRRMEQQREEIEARANERLVKRLVDVRTDLSRAVDTKEQSAKDLREGVGMILQNLDRILDAEDVEEIDPDPGDEVDPHRHEVMMRVDSDRPADEIVEVFEPGYAQADRILTPAKVTVSNGEADQSEE